MKVTRSGQWRQAVLAVCCVGAACLWPLPAWGRSPTPEELRRQAEQAEQRGDWIEACALYERLPVRERVQAETRKRYLACARNAQRVRRYRDPSYHQQVLQLTLSHALILYEEVLEKLYKGYVDRTRAEIGQLFKHGLEELGMALGDPDFSRAYVTAAPDAVRDFRTQLTTYAAERNPRKAREAAHEAGLLAQSAEETLGVLPVVVVLELTCGACAALDEFTFYLTPGRFTELNNSLKGEMIGIGIEVVVGNRKLMISQVLPGSPAQMAGLSQGDYVLRLGGKPTEEVTAEAAAELLAGPLGTTLELEVLSRDSQEARLLMLPRQLLRVPSVSVPRFVGPEGGGLGYLQITAFHDHTPLELDDALRDLQAAGMKALVLDLRGNPGGPVSAALEVVKRFVPAGVIASSKGQAEEFNKKYQAANPHALNVPLVVLVDGGTASVAELAAGALKERERATLVGQTTFGKGLLQGIRPIASNSAGIQLTVARFFSPRGRVYEGKGIEPHRSVNRDPPETMMDLSQDLQLETAIEVARGYVMGR